MVRADQLAAVRRSVQAAIPINMAIGLSGAAIAAHAGAWLGALIWFGVSTAINLWRIALCRFGAAPLERLEGPKGSAATNSLVERQLRLASWAALASGAVWSCQSLLCGGYEGPLALYFLVMTCGVTAGAVTHGTAYARIPLCFITPPLLTVAACLVSCGKFNATLLAACVLLYLFALIRSSLQSEAAFRRSSWLKNEATALARSLAAANGRATAFAEEMGVRANRDSLTNLLNRAGFVGEIERRMAASAASPCLLLLDLDGFKSINDAFGHATGDKVLKEVATRFAALAPAGSSVARLGGDEFAIYFEPHAGAKTSEIVERLHAAMGAPAQASPTSRLGVSIGIHCGRSASLTEMLNCADEALYSAKSMGRNRSCMFDDALRQRLEIRRDTERDLLAALARNEVETWFQPILGEGGTAVSGFETLLRWKHARHGWISPPDIIAAAVAGGNSEPLLECVVKGACAMLAATLAEGRESVQVSVNLSPREIAGLPVDRIILSALDRTSLPPDRFEVEITEEVALDIGAARDKLSALASAGVRVAIDDFGVGFSSLASLRELRPDRVKIDRCFVTGLADSPDDQALIGAIVGLGRSMGFDVVAEGVETESDLVMLRATGCRLMQGYGLGRPMPHAAALDWIATADRQAA